MCNTYISLCVPKYLVKTIKTRLEEQGKLFSGTKITQFNSTRANHQVYMIIPSNVSGAGITQVQNHAQKHSILAAFGLEEFLDVIECIVEYKDYQSESSSKIGVNPLTKAVKLGLESMPPELFQENSLNMKLLLSRLSTTYSLYPPLLLLPKHVFAASEWKRVLSSATQEQMQQFYQSIAKSMSVTHIATNAPIPRLDEGHEGSKTTTQENILRSPTHLQSLYGDFGPIVNSPNPNTEDFSSAFWVSTRQNGIVQVWAPRYTMFSRGNISEKARVLNLPSVKEAVQQGAEDGRGCAAVDLYAGIGYFAFSYAKAGLSKIYCWELNPWSVEGFKRGADKNKWLVGMTKGEEFDEDAPLDDTAKFVVFKGDNAKAASIIERSRTSMPPIRHVNCGLLPTSKGSWETAVRILDPELGGWIHLHENIATGAIQANSQEILEHIQQLVDSTSEGNEGAGSRRLATIGHVEQVKTYAPGVMHCVLDIHISS